MCDLESDKNQIIGLLSNLINGRDLQVTEASLTKYSLCAGYGLLLLSIFSNENGNGNINDDSIRHQSGILLKNHLYKNWENDVISDSTKERIKDLILNKSLFCDSNSKIRKTTAMIISVLAEFDFPEKWKNLLNIILSYISESASNKNILLLSASILNLKYFIEHICDLQIKNIGPILFPLLLQIISEQTINLNIRYDALSIYHNLLNISLEIRMINGNLTKSLINPTILKYLQIINNILNIEDIQYIKLQTLSLNILNDITKSYSLSIINCLPMILASTWKLMLFYSSNSVSMDNEDSIILFYDNAFLWIYTILKHKRKEIGNLLDDKLNDISSLIIKLLNLTDDDMDLFISSPNEFILNEENIYYQNNLRSLIRNVIIQILDIRPRTGYYSLLQSAKKRISNNDNMFDRESVLLIFGYLAQNNSCSTSSKFKMEDFLQKILWKDLHCKNNQLLQYRALWTLSKFIYSLNINAKKQILPLIIECMKSPNPLCIRYESIKCFEAICIDNDNNINIDSLLNGVIPILCHLLTKMDDSTLKYLLKCLYSIIKLNKIQCIKYESSIIPLIIDLWSKPKHCLNADITHYIKQIISIYVSCDLSQINVIKHIIPTISKILNTSNVSVIHSSLEIIHILMIYSFKNKNNGNNGNVNDEINNIYYKQFLPQILNLVYNTTDSDIMNIGAKILCLLINNNPNLMMNDKSMIHCLCQIISKFLSSQIPENASNGIGPLINQLIINLKCTLNDEMFTNLLLTIIERINNCFTATLRNQLLLIFPRLIHEYGAMQIITFLHKNNKLNNILIAWCSNHNDFIYPYYKKLSITALAKILETNDNLIKNITFNGYPIININAPRSSRSKSHQLQYTKMSFLAKFFQILLETFKDLVYSINDTDDDEDDDDNDDDEEETDDDEHEQETEQETEDDEDYEEEEEEDDEYEEEEDDEDDIDDNDEKEEILKLNENINNNELLIHTKTMNHSQSKKCIKDIELELFPEAANDKIFYIEFEKWSKDFIKQISNQNAAAFQNIILSLNDDHKNILRKILNS